MVQMVNETEFPQVIANSTVVLVKFGAPWCAPCKALAPILEQVATEGHTVVEVDADESPDLSIQYKVRGLPTMIVFRDGQPAERLSGVQSKDKILELLK